MTWEQKLLALKALTSTHLEMRSPGDWYVSAYDRFIRDGSVVIGRYGNGSTPEAAVEDDWAQMTASGVVVNTHSRRFRWNGFMWKEVPTPTPDKEQP